MKVPQQDGRGPQGALPIHRTELCPKRAAEIRGESTKCFTGFERSGRTCLFCATRDTPLLIITVSRPWTGLRPAHPASNKAHVPHVGGPPMRHGPPCQSGDRRHEAGAVGNRRGDDVAPPRPRRTRLPGARVAPESARRHGANRAPAQPHQHAPLWRPGPRQPPGTKERTPSNRAVLTNVGYALHSPIEMCCADSVRRTRTALREIGQE